MFIFNAFKWFAVVLLLTTIVRVIVNKNGGWKAASEKMQSWYKIPVAGVLLRIAVKFFKVAGNAIWSTLTWMSKWPIVSTIIAVMRKFGGIIVQKWSKIVAWSESE